MACGGPDKDFSVIRSQDAYVRVLQMLCESYHVERPPTFNNTGFEKRMQDDWDLDSEKLKMILADLFWTSDASNF